MDYENYEFRSPIHPVNPQDHFAKDYEKTKFLEFDVLKGYVLYIPPYWWYSIEYSETNTFVAGVSYMTTMNCVSNLPNLTIHWLQRQNITKKITKIKPPVQKEIPVQEQLEQKKREQEVDVTPLSASIEIKDSVVREDPSLANKIDL